MGVMDKFLSSIHLNMNDEDEYEEAYEEETKPTSVKEENTAIQNSDKIISVQEAARERNLRASSKITPITSKGSRKQALGMEVCVIKPSTIEDEMEITDTLLNGRTVVINMEGLNVDLAQRIIDFTSGSTYAIHGNLQKISNYIFLATPNGVDISGDIQNLMESFNLPGFNQQ